MHRPGGDLNTLQLTHTRTLHYEPTTYSRLTHSPRADVSLYLHRSGSGDSNEGLDKGAARLLLRWLLQGEQPPPPQQPPPPPPSDAAATTRALVAGGGRRTNVARGPTSEGRG